MSARDEILAKVRKSTGAGDPNDAARTAAVNERLSAAPRGVVPQRGNLEPAERVDLFQREAERVSAQVTRIASHGDLPGHVSDFLRSNNLPQRIRHGDDSRLRDLPWAEVPSLEVSQGASDGSDLACLSHAASGVAETGTLLLNSGTDNPTTLNFLPDYHIVVVKSSDIVSDLETAFSSVRATYGKGYMPRTVNFVTGPSRSADIEQTLLLGAHGPRKLQIFIVDEADIPESKSG